MLELSGVSVSIAGVPVLRGVSLKVPAGGRVALIGRNGAGKTTTLRTLMGLVPAAQGKVMIDGEDETRLPPHHRPRHGIGYAPEERRLFGSFHAERPRRVCRRSGGVERRHERQGLRGGRHQLRDGRHQLFVGWQRSDRRERRCRGW